MSMNCLGMGDFTATIIPRWAPLLPPFSGAEAGDVGVVGGDIAGRVSASFTEVANASGDGERCAPSPPAASFSGGGEDGVDPGAGTAAGGRGDVAP